MGGKDKKSTLDPASQSTTPAASTTASAASSRATTPTSNGGLAKEEKPLPDGKTQDDSSKLRTFISILKRFIGVTDIAAVRFSLPAQLLEPIPNLEYWHYLDRPETFVAIGDSDDDLGRMLGCLRFWFSKDLKYVKGKPCKPYNSTLGEFFRCQWEVEDTLPTLRGSKSNDTTTQTTTASAPSGPVKVSYITEQTSHHPPVSAFYVECPDKGISARGFDQLSAKFTGTSIRVVPGQYNEGIFLTLHNRGDEEYQLTHPAAYLGGFLRGNLYVTVSDTCTITCAKTGLRVVLHYLEEGYFGKVQNKLEGVIYKYDAKTSKTTKLKDIPEKDILGRVEGVWTDKVYFTPGATEFRKVPEKDRLLILDLNPLTPVPKRCPPPEEQLPNESRRFWSDVTEAIMAKQYSTATTRKQELEERQRERAREREQAGADTWKPRFFTGVTEPKGRPELSGDGKLAMEGLQKEEWHLDPPAEYGAM